MTNSVERTFDKDPLPNYCHDVEIKEVAARLGITDLELINHALRLGESAIYNGGYDAAVDFLMENARQIISQRSERRKKQPRTALSKRAKEEIENRYLGNAEWD